MQGAGRPWGGRVVTGEPESRALCSQRPDDAACFTPPSSLGKFSLLPHCDSPSSWGWSGERSTVGVASFLWSLRSHSHTRLGKRLRSVLKSSSPSSTGILQNTCPGFFWSPSSTQCQLPPCAEQVCWARGTHTHEPQRVWDAPMGGGLRSVQEQLTLRGRRAQT